MMKFFRKHMKKLLAVFMCLLLISWLGGSALEYMLRPDQAAGVTATYLAGDITQRELIHAERQTKWLEGLRLPWQFPLGRMQAAPLDVPSWFLLQKEARRMGMHSSQPVVDLTLRQHQEAFRRRGLGVPSVARLASGVNVKTDVIYDAVAAYTDVVRYATRMAQAASVSTAEIRRCADDALSQVQVRAIVLPAEMFADADDTFSEPEIREQFDTYRNQKRSGKGLSFGYVLPPRVKVQYAKIDPARIEETLSIDPRKLEKEANRYWRGNKQDPAFERPPEEDSDDDSTTQPVDDATAPSGDEATTRTADAGPDTQPATAPAEAEEQASPFFTTWAEAREAAIRLTRRKHAAEQAEKLAQWLKDQAAVPWDRAEVGTNGYRIPPRSVRETDYYARMLSDAPASLPGVEGVTVSTTEWISPEDVLDVPGIGSSSLPNPTGAPILFSQVVFNVEGLARIPRGEDAVGVDRTAFMALYQTCPYAMRDFDGSIYVFRPLEVDDERPPNNLEEVRDRVIADLRLARGYEEAQAEARRLHQDAPRDGLQAVWDAAPELQQTVDQYNETTGRTVPKAGFHETVAVNRRTITGDYTKRLPQVGEVDEIFLETCFAMRDADTAESRVRVIDMPQAGAVVVVEWIKDAPLDEDRFKLVKSYLAQQLQSQRAADYLSSWLDPKQIKARNRFEFKRGG